MEKDEIAKKLKVIYRPKGRALEYSEWALNIATGCSHGCGYCYAPAVLRKSRMLFESDTSIRAGLFEKLEKDLLLLRENGVSDRVLLCFATDPYCNEEMAKTTRRCLERFVEHGVPFQVLTKAGMRATRDFDLYRTCDAFGTTLTFCNEHDSRTHEPHAALPVDRLKAIEEAHRRNIFIWVSFEPVIDAWQTEALFKTVYPFVDLFKIGKTNHGYPCDVKSWAEFGFRMERLCEENKKAYYIKEDLMKEMVKADGREWK